MGIFSQDEEPCWSDVIHLEEQVKKLKASNEELTSDNLNTIQEMDNERRRVEQLKQDIEAYKQSEQEAQEIIAELKAENKELAHYLACMTEQRNKANTCLQEIKEFCKKEIEYFDNNDNYGQQADWIALLQKIAKAEEE